GSRKSEDGSRLRRTGGPGPFPLIRRRVVALRAGRRTGGPGPFTLICGRVVADRVEKRSSVSEGGSPARRQTKGQRAVNSSARRDFRLPTSVFRLPSSDFRLPSLTAR